MTKNLIDKDTLSILESGILKSGAPYDIVMLDMRHLGAAKAFHDGIIDALEQTEKVFMLRKPADFFAYHLSGTQGNAIIGVISNGVLVGQAVICHPTAAKPETGMVDMKPVAAPQDVSVLQAVSILPACRGSGLMNRLVDHWVDHAVKYDRAHLLAEIDIRNKASWRAFLHGGLSLASIGTDPADGTQVYNAHETTQTALVKRLSPLFNEHSAYPAAACAQADLEEQKKFLKAGWVIAGYNAARAEFLMATP